MLAALADGAVMGTARLAAATGLAPVALVAVLLDLELAGRVRCTAAGIQAVGPREAAGREGTCAEPMWLSQPAPTLRPGRVDAGSRQRRATGQPLHQEAAMFRQGDVLLVPILEAELPAAVVPVARDGRGALVLGAGGGHRARARRAHG